MAEAATHCYRLEVSTDQMEAILFLEVRGRENRPAVRTIVRELIEEHHLYEPLEDQVEEAVALAAGAEEGDALPGVCIARGVPPTPGEDGELRWLGDFFESHAVLLPDGGVDHYHHTRSSVYEGQPLVEVVAPGPGREGRDVFGHELAASGGQPAVLHLGDGVGWQPENASVVVALRGGRVEYNQDHLGVSELLSVQEVDYAVGSIDFDGSVEVQGDVRARFEVRGGASVIIAGCVENAEIESDGQVEIRGPVLGRGQALLVSGADMLLSSAREAEIHCGGTLVVQRELLWCHCEVFNDLCLDGGRVVGGTLHVGGKVVAAELGSREEVATVIQLGESMGRSRALRRLTRDRKRADETLQAFARQHSAQLQRGEAAPYPPAEREALLQRQAALRAVARRARRRELILRKRLQRRRDASCLMVRGTVHPGVAISFDGRLRVHRISEPVQGPVRIGLDSRGEELLVEAL